MDKCVVFLWFLNKGSRVIFFSSAVLTKVKGKAVPVTGRGGP
jgi:hypothetical protein